MRSRTKLMIAALAAATGLLVPNLQADPIAKAKQELAAEAKRYNGDGKFKLAFELDWSSVKDASSASMWAGKCGAVMEKVAKLCQSDVTYKPVDACIAHINANIRTVRCVPVADSDLERAELKGQTLVYQLAEGMSSNAREAADKAMRTMLPKRAGILLQHDVDAYFAKQREFEKAKLTVDVASFLKDGDITGLSGIATYCAPAWRFLAMLNHPECQLKTCKGDGAKKRKLVEGATHLRCVHAKKPTVPERKGDALVFATGEWASETGSLDGIPFAAFDELRGKLKLRDCGVDESSMDPRGAGGVMTRAARQKCCPKDAKGACMSLAYDKHDEVCAFVGFTTEKACHRRDRLTKEVLSKAR
jgi:hypothetical protein